MFTGQPGKKYGLIMPTRPGQPGAPSAPKPAAPPPAKKSVAAVFGDDDDDDNDPDTMARQLELQQAKKRADQKVAEMHKKLLEADPTLYDYDGVYDQMQKERIEPKLQEKVARKPKYVEALLAKAQERKIEQDILFERRNAKQVAKEEEELGPTEKYITAAYKRKLEEQKRWTAEDKAREEKEEREDVTKRSGLGDLHRNLLKSGALLGGRTAPVGEAQVSDKPQPDAGAASAAGAAAAAGAPIRPAAPAGGEPEGTGRAAAAPEARPVGGEGLGDREEGAAAAAASREEPPAPAAAPAPAPLPPQETKEDKAAAARERYLARKRKAEGAPGGK